jgi:7-cyano-7-deazaguanine reductase
MLYGEKEIAEFDLDRDFEIWPNKHEKNYTVKVTLPEFSCLCPRSGYPDFATFHIEYVPDAYVAELKALKLYINTFRNRHISHEDSANEVYDMLKNKINPRKLKLVADFNQRGNVHTVIEINSEEN